jgi:hypothetical protein
MGHTIAPVQPSDSSGSSLAVRASVIQQTEIKVEFEHFLPSASLACVKWIKAVMVWTMLALWLPATNHCRLESIPGLLFLACDQAPEADAHQETDCESDNCALVESALYKVEDSQVNVKSPMTPESLILPVLQTPSLATARPGFVHTVAPPELAVAWQFCTRAAAPPRAPSFVS